MAINGSINVPNNGALVARIMDRVITDDNGCWLWQGKPASCGHGQISYKGRTWGTHRIIYAYYHGKIEDGLNVLHSCDVPNCCNPEHLEAGTQKRNVADCISRGRTGERGRKTGLTMVDAAEIRLRYFDGEKVSQLVEDFKISRTNVYKIIRNEIWNDL